MGLGTWIIVLAVALVAVALLVTYRVVRPVVDNVANLTEEAKAIAKGRYEHHLPILRGDEFGDLAEAFSRMRAELAKQVDQFRRRRDQLATVMGSMNEGVLALDDQRRILFANRAACELLDAAVSQIDGRPLWEVIRHPDVDKAVELAFKERAAQRAEFELVDKTTRQLDMRVTRLPGDPVPGLVLVLHDVTELRRLERLRQDFVANVSHELKTPLTSIKTFAETLRDGAIYDPDHNVAFVKRIEKQAARLETLILDMLSLASIESGQQAFDVVTIALDECVAERLATHAQLAESKGIELRTHRPSDTVLARADEEGLRQILDNLLDNAIKYTPEGGAVTVGWRRDGDWAVIEVSDTGIGIAAADRKRIFERFFRVDRARSREVGGTGLGLSIVKHLAQAFGGSVAVESQPKRGSVFSVKLPAA